jgi:hypothetical protein
MLRFPPIGRREPPVEAEGELALDYLGSTVMGTAKDIDGRREGSASPARSRFDFLVSAQVTEPMRSSLCAVLGLLFMATTGCSSTRRAGQADVAAEALPQSTADAPADVVAPAAGEGVAPDRDAEAEPDAPGGMRAEAHAPPDATSFVVPLPPPVPADSPYPAVTRGPALRIASTLETDTPEASGRRALTVAHPDPGIAAALETRLSSLPGGCRAELAIERLLSVSCGHTDGNAHSSADGYLFALQDGVATPLDELTLFHEGVDRFDLLRRLQYDPEGGVVPFLVTEKGIELRYDSDRIARFPWRSVAPLLRPDTAIGEALAAQGVPLAAAGVPFPPLPPETIGLWAHDRGSLTADPGVLVDVWRRLPEGLQAAARLVHPGGQSGAALVFPPGTPPPALPADIPRTRPGRAYWVEPLAEIVLAQANAPLELRGSPGKGTDVLWRRPAGTILTVVRGLVERTDSDLGRAHWAFAAVRGSAAWTHGRALDPVDPACAHLERGDGTEPPDAASERGLLETEGGRYAWFVDGDRRTGEPGSLSIYSVDGCAVGTLVQRQRLPGGLLDLLVVTTERESGRTLLVARAGAVYGATVIVLDPARDTPLLEVPRVDEAAVGLDRGPDRAAGWFPVRLTSTGGTATWYRWTGETLEAVTP